MADLDVTAIFVAKKDATKTHSKTLSTRHLITDHGYSRQLIFAVARVISKYLHIYLSTHVDVSILSCNSLGDITPELSGLSAPSSSNDTGAGARTASGEDEVNRSGLSAALIIVAGLSLALAATFTLSLALGKLGATRGEYSLNTR